MAGRRCDYRCSRYRYYVLISARRRLTAVYRREDVTPAAGPISGGRLRFADSSRDPVVRFWPYRFRVVAFNATVSERVRCTVKLNDRRVSPASVGLVSLFLTSFTTFARVFFNELPRGRVTDVS